MEIIFILIAKFITQLLAWKLHCLPALKQLPYCRPVFFVYSLDRSDENYAYEKKDVVFEVKKDDKIV